MLQLPRFRRFRTRLLLIILGLLVAALGSSYVLVTRANKANAIAHIESNLAGAVRVFWFSVQLRQERLAQSAAVMSADWPIRTLYLQDELDRATLRSTLTSYADRLQVPVVATFDNDGEMLATTMIGLTDEHCGPFRYLVRRADEESTEYASDFAYLGGQLHVLVVVPLFAPRPNVIGWFAVAFPIDDEFATNLRRSTQAEVTFVSGLGDHDRRVLATSLPAALARTVAAHKLTDTSRHEGTSIISMDGEPYVTLLAPLDLLGDDPARIALQRSLTAELAPARELEKTILLISVIALVMASVVAIGVARGVSQPVQELAAHTEVIASGDYKTHLHPNRSDEFGRLAESFNRMSDGLAERDQVRDLLDKNVSPEIAAQLMRDGAILGGEEREITVLFADLRGFTPLSEKLPPRELIDLLNRYLECMSAEIERHGGVIDKFIGDAIMAIFGAPVDQPDAAGQALRAALAMEQALIGFNAELRAEGRPDLAIGIGINTAQVVAGNIGSKRRLNYSVIGDGVNVAARLETQTRNPEYRTNILVSAATLAATSSQFHTRALGTINVKGRNEPVTVFALDGLA
ncbi:MAG: HAMP domain-containing protein [Cephaloticoccus sp.]|nr:HAMP domain-containing protein [Cephaloticoccus sp.]MCF7758993.1 HAMP domain-containing protein [Cephaloticoccus sp.]